MSNQNKRSRHRRYPSNSSARRNSNTPIPNHESDTSSAPASQIPLPLHLPQHVPQRSTSAADASENWRSRPSPLAIQHNLEHFQSDRADSPIRPPPPQATAPKTTVMRHTQQYVRQPTGDKLWQKGVGQGKKMPLRTTKTSQKLVLFPDEVDDDRLHAIPILEDPQLQNASEAAQMLEALPLSERQEDRTEAERLGKDMRMGLPRVTAYCTAEGYRMADLHDYLRREHKVHSKLYDECLYVPYYFPLILGDGYRARLRSSLPPKHARDGVPVDDAAKGRHVSRESYEEDHIMHDAGLWGVTPGIHPDTAPGGEVFFFEYGVTVFWNFAEEEELDVLADIARFEEQKLASDDIQIEEFHFQYDRYSKSSRIFNDMITLRTSNHMIKLTISHAISQSVTLTLFEGRMENTIDYTRHIPKTLAETGEVKLSRNKVTKIVGHLFKLRIAVNLVSNVLDTPEIFWSEPSLQPLYKAIKGYLEISQRAKVLNDRCSVIADLLDMLREHMSSAHMAYLNWIVIWLILVAVFVALGEIGVKMLSL